MYSYLKHKNYFMIISIIIFSLIFTLISFGQIFTRWDLLEHISMSDRFISGGKIGRASCRERV